MQSTNGCRQCGRGSHSFQACPARDATCFRCRRKGHFGNKCLSRTVAEVTDSVDDLDINSQDDSYLDVAYLNTITRDSKSLHCRNTHGNHLQPHPCSTNQSNFCGPDHRPLQVLGEASVTLSIKGKQCKQTLYVVGQLKNNLWAY